MSKPVQLIVRLPYNRPQDGSVSNPPIIHWTPDKEHLFWEVIAKSRDTEGSSIEWSALAEHLEVPLPYLLYRAGKRFEEGLQAVQQMKAMTTSPDPSNLESSKKERRPSNAMIRRLSGQNSATAGAGRASSLHSSPKAGTIRLAGSGYQSGLHARAPSSSSIATMTHRALHPATAGRPFSAIQSGSSSSSDGEGAAEEEEDQQLMEKEEASRRIRELERLVNQTTLQFAQPSRSHVSPSPRRTRPSQKPPSEASSSVHTDRYEASASVSPSSPASIGVPQQAALRREEAAHSPSPPPSAFQRGRQQLRVSTSDRNTNSTAPSTSSSFSDISDVSTSALEEAAGSSFRPPPSRLTVFARNHLGRHY